MKRLLIIFFTIPFFLSSFGQDNVTGEYYDSFGCKLILNSDSTFEFTWHFDLAGSWSKGKWLIDKDTIILENIAVYDTVIYTDTISVNKIEKREELVLSADDSSEMISVTEAVLSSISGGGQNRKAPPDKLIYRRNRLYLLDKNGKIDNKKHPTLLTGKKYKSYYREIQL